MKLSCHAFITTICLCAITVLTACTANSGRNIPSEDEMVSLLFDYQLAEGMADNMDGNKEANLLELRANVLKQHNMSQSDFDSAMVYYNRHADVYQKICERVVDRLQHEASLLGASINDGSAMSEAGDTTDVWQWQRSAVLTPNAPFNRIDFSLQTDTAWHKGDAVTLAFDANFIFQDGIRDGVAMLAVTFRNDSTGSQYIHINNAMPYTVQIYDPEKVGIKSVRGFILLTRNPQDAATTTTLHLMTISNIRLLRRHTRPTPPLPDAKTDTIVPPTAPGAAASQPDMPATPAPDRSGANTLPPHELNRELPKSPTVPPHVLNRNLPRKLTKAPEERIKQ